MADGARCSNLSFTFFQTAEPPEISPRWWATEFLWGLCPTLVYTIFFVPRHLISTFCSLDTINIILCNHLCHVFFSVMTINGSADYLIAESRINIAPTQECEGPLLTAPDKSKLPLVVLAK